MRINNRHMKDPKQSAIAFIEPYILRGESVNNLIQSCMGYGDGEIGIQVNVKNVWSHDVTRILTTAKRDEIVVQYADDSVYKYNLYALAKEILQPQMALF